jgi:hypothetical protein
MEFERASRGDLWTEVTIEKPANPRFHARLSVLTLKFQGPIFVELELTTNVEGSTRPRSIPLDAYELPLRIEANPQATDRAILKTDILNRPRRVKLEVFGRPFAAQIKAGAPVQRAGWGSRGSELSQVLDVSEGKASAPEPA